MQKHLRRAICRAAPGLVPLDRSGPAIQRTRHRFRHPPAAGPASDRRAAPLRAPRPGRAAPRPAVPRLAAAFLPFANEARPNHRPPRGHLATDPPAVQSPRRLQAVLTAAAAHGSEVHIHGGRRPADELSVLRLVVPAATLRRRRRVRPILPCEGSRVSAAGRWGFQAESRLHFTTNWRMGVGEGGGGIKSRPTAGCSSSHTRPFCVQSVQCRVGIAVCTG